MTLPAAVRRAGFIVAAEGVAALVVSVVLVVRALGGADQHIVSGYGTAVWFVLIGAAVLAGGWALITGRRWGRGIAVFAKLLLWGGLVHLRSHQLGYAYGRARRGAGSLVLLFSPSAVQWASGRTEPPRVSRRHLLCARQFDEFLARDPIGDPFGLRLPPTSS